MISTKVAGTRRGGDDSPPARDMPDFMSEKEEVSGAYYCEDLNELSNINMGSLNRFIGSSG